MKNEMTVNDLADLKAHEEIIQKTKGAFVECGFALSKIREGKLYRKEFKTFQEYCEKKWGWGSNYSNKLISAAIVVKKLPKKLGTMVPGERAARALADIPEEDREAVVLRAKESGEVTAASIAEAGKVVEVKKPRLDKLNRAIPPEIIKDWDRAEEIGSHLRSLISEVKCAVEKGLGDHDMIFSELHNPDISPLVASHYTLSQILPHAVCTTCHGQSRDKCRLCLGRGFISKFRFDQCVPSETKALLKKIKK